MYHSRLPAIVTRSGIAVVHGGFRQRDWLRENAVRTPLWWARPVMARALAAPLLHASIGSLAVRQDRSSRAGRGRFLQPR
jgi:hypothetical protein